MYKEKEVEMWAWEIHGGPIGFERMLDDKEAKFRAKHGPGKPFPRPRYYPSKATGGPMIYVIDPASQRHIPDPETSTPGRINMKAEFAQKNAEWLWDAINKAIRNEWELSSGWGREPRGKPREAIVQDAMEQVVNGDLEYPERPASSPPESTSFCGLRTTLAEAPIHDPSRADVPGIEIHDDHVTGCRSVHWHSSYLAKVYACLTNVILEHGLDGWAHARWLVYDQVSIQAIKWHCFNARFLCYI
ncbi:hypothetical protein HYPSUDRAFT_45624 [Hypholoma sublateritium FD-334 SS-4]|uniref:Uncharacterized protein n=1 Tax=Hypholoma sublateritium (strain FD-334 SS-4) TaxID=945553 RepID=A0A0D2M4C9_HYPSF|nr:hypothetical protein HYPSUDRAFT_45624 [Hypholoma sublateritium FD-334 SS-4]